MSSPLPRPTAEALVQSLQRELDLQPPQAILQAAWQHFGTQAALSCSGAEDVALVALMRDFGLDFRVFCLDTGRLHPETYRLLEDIREKYALQIDVFFPDRSAVERLVADKGLFSFYRDGHGECCAIRKVEPLQRALAGRPAWITGQRRDQSPDTRAEVPVVQIDEARSSATHAVLKFNPLARWTSAQVWKYLRAAEVPYNRLHEQGYVSIGCAPCTRPVLPGQHEREGRWWWESADHKECGLHAVAGPAQDR
jgi:phosphoadenosine phosphosulfate reductase